MEVVADDLGPVQLAFHRSTEFLGEVRIHSVSSTTRTNSVWFSTKGQVVIPAWLRKQFQIEDGARVVVQANRPNTEIGSEGWRNATPGSARVALGRHQASGLAVGEPGDDLVGGGVTEDLG